MSCSPSAHVKCYVAVTDRRPFNEGAAQVKKLLNRDKRELMGAEQIGERARTEFDEDDNKPSTSSRSNGASSTESTRLFGEGMWAMHLCISCCQTQPTYISSFIHLYVC